MGDHIPQPPSFVVSVEEQLRIWHEAFPAQTVREHIDALKTQHAALTKQIAQLEEEYTRWESFNLAQRNPEQNKFAATIMDGSLPRRRRQVPNEKRDAILILLWRHPPMRNAEIREALVFSGVLPEGERFRKQVDVTLHNLVKTGELVRSDFGYTLSILGEKAAEKLMADDQASTLTDVRSEDGDA